MIGKSLNMLMPKRQAYSHDLHLQSYAPDRESKVLGFTREVPFREKSGAIRLGQLEVRSHVSLD